MSEYDQLALQRARWLAHRAMRDEQHGALERKLAEIDPDARVLSERVAWKDVGGKTRYRVTFVVAFQRRRRRMTGEADDLHLARVAALDRGVQLRMLELDEEADRAGAEG